MFRPASIHGRICKPFPGGRRSPSPGIDLVHFRIKDVTVQALSLAREVFPCDPCIPFSAFLKVLLELLG
jgi:hypothetical protein